jgi:hypothetical protein
MLRNFKILAIKNELKLILKNTIKEVFFNKSKDYIELKISRMKLLLKE